MKTKIAEFLADYIPSLSKEEIEQLIETPPTQDMGDLAFPCFRLAKSYHKAVCRQYPEENCLCRRLRTL